MRKSREFLQKKGGGEAETEVRRTEDALAGRLMPIISIKLTNMTIIV
jgi:hypothetical protein